MMETITYVNKETDKTIELPLNKKRIFIYGKNGSGKTTFSNSNDLDDNFVFNESFIRRNVYIIDNEGAKVDSNVKSHFSSLLIGEEVVILRQKLDNYNDKKKEIKGKIEIINSQINNNLNGAGITFDNSLLTEEIIDNEIKYPEDDDLEKIKKDYKFENFDKDYKKLTDEEIRQHLIKIKDNALVKQLIDNINKTKYLKEYIFKKENNNISQLNTKLENITENIKDIESIEEVLEQKNISINDWQTVKKCIELQEKSKSNECILCGNENFEQGLSKWNILKNNELAKNKDEVIHLLKSEVDVINNLIIENNEFYKKIEPKTVKIVEEFLGLLTSIIKEIEENKPSSVIKTKELDLGDLVTNISQLIKTVVYNLSLDYIDDYVFYNSINLDLSKKIDSLKIKIEKKMEENANKYEQDINTILRELGVDNKNIELKVEKRGGLEIKYSLNIKENAIAELSDGQKHKLALAVFLNSIKNKELANKIIVFDDPIVSLDELSYHLFKDYIIQKLLAKYDKSNSPTLIILTHNFSYFNIQISNILNNEELRNESKILRMDSNGLHIMNPDIFKLDDIALYRNALCNASCQKDIINIATISNKIIREMIDIKLRFEGKAINDNPEIEIPQLNIGDKMKELKESEHTTVQFRKRKSIDFENAINCIRATKKSAEILGFDSFISEEIINKINNIRVDECETSDENIIIGEIADLFRNEDENKNYIQYLNHPRVSFTKNLFSSALDLHE